MWQTGTDFPCRDWYPKGCKVVQIDTREDLGRRVPVVVGLTGDVGATLRALLPLLKAAPDHGHLDNARDAGRTGVAVLPASGRTVPGSMANAMPQALRAQLWAPDRQTVAFCGNGGLSMLLGGS